MSTTIDQRVVEMQFDNKHFERNVATTMSTLDKLKQGLNLTGATKGLSDLGDAAKGINLSGLGGAVETVQAKFSALGVIGVTALANITNQAVNTGKRMISALTIDPIKTGFSEYETKMGAIQTIMSNTASKGTTMQDVTRVIGELNTYADKTIYNFAEMTRNIGTFTAAGVGLEESASAIQGIANLAAASGSTSQQASTAMYQLSQALAAGTVKLMDWNSVVNAGMGGEKFQEALKATAREHGIAVDALIKKNGSFRESLQEGWISADILNETLRKFTVEGATEYANSMVKAGKYTQEQADALIKEAQAMEDAATKVKTFTQLWDTLKESAQSGWGQTWEILVGDFEEAKKTLTEISDVIGGMIGDSANSRNELLTGALSTGWKQLLSEGIDDAAGFQEMVTNVAKEHGVKLDEMIDEETTFQDTLKEGWLTGDMLTESVTKFTDKLSNMSDEELKAAGYTKETVDKMKELCKQVETGKISMEEFAEKMARPSGRELLIESLWNAFNGILSVVKPVKEAFREIFPAMEAEKLYSIIESFRDFTERLKLSDNASDNLKRTFKGLFAILDIGKKLLTAVFNAIKPVFGGLDNLGGGILEITATWGDWLVKLNETVESSDIFNRVMERVTQVVKTVADGVRVLVDWVKDLAGAFKANFIAPGLEILDSILNRAGQRMTGLGDISDSMRDSVVTAIEAMGSALANSNFVKLMQTLWNGIKSVGSAIAKAFGSITGSVIGKLGNGDFVGFFDALNSLIAGGIGVGLIRFLKSVTDTFKGFQDMTDGIVDIFDGVRGCFEAYQTQLKAGTLMKIAGAIAILTAAIVVLALIDSEKLNGAIGAITMLFAELMGSMAIFSKISGNMKGVAKTTGAMIGMSVAVLILAAALKKLGGMEWEDLAKGVLGVAALMGIVVASVKILGKGKKAVVKGAVQMVIFAAAIKVLASVCKDLSTLNWEQLAKGLIGVGVLMAEIAMFLKLAKFSGKAITTATGIVILAAAIKILASVCGEFAKMEWEDIGKGLTGIGALLLEVAAFTRLTGNAKKVIASGAALVIIAAAMKIFATVLHDMRDLSWEEIAKGLTGMAGALLAVTLATRFMPKNMVGIGIGLIAVAGAMKIMAEVLGTMGGMDWITIGKGLAAIGGSVAILAIGLNLMKGTLAGSAAMLVAATSLAILTPVMTTLGNLSWEEIAKGLVSIAGAFAVLGVAGLVLGPVVPAILGLAGAFALIGVGVLAIGAGLVVAGAGLSALAIGVSALATAVAGGATAITAGLTVIVMGIANLIPMVIQKLGEGLIRFCKVITDGAPAIGDAVKAIVLTLVDVLVECVPAIADGALQLIAGVLAALATYTPQIVDSLFQFLISLLDGIANNIPKLIQSAVNVIMSFFQGVVDALRGIDVGTLLKGIVGIGLMSAMMFALSAVAALIPGAMVGVLGMGAVIAELAIVLAAIGALAQIPGLKWLIDEGGELLQSIGTAIGSFIGGIVGGVMGGISAQFPQIGEDLSAFMTNLKPFIDGAKAIDPAVVDGVKAIAETILILTAANILEGLTAWFTGGSSLATFGEQLPALGTNLNAFATNLGTFDESKVATVTCAANAIKALAEAANAIPNEGGWAAKIFGENSIATFGSYLPVLGTNLGAFATNLGTFTEAQVSTVTCAANAIKSLAEAADEIPNEGGWAAKIFGENSISTFAEKLPEVGAKLGEFATNLGTFDEGKVSTVACAGEAIKALANASSEIDGQAEWAKALFGDNSIATFAAKLPDVGTKLGEFAANLGTFDESKVATVTCAANAIKAMAAAGENIDGQAEWAKKLFGDNGIAAFSGELPAVGTNLSSFAENLGTFGSDKVATVDAAVNALGAFAKLANADLSGAKSNLSGFGDKIVELATDISDFCTNLPSGESITSAVDNMKKILSAIKDIGSAETDGIKNFVDSLKNLGEDAVDKFVSAFTSSSAKTDVKKAAKDLANQAVKGIEDKSDDIEEAMEDAASDAASAAKDSRKKFYDAGSHLVSGFASGISENAYKAEAKARAMAKAAATAAEEALDINSPSKVFRAIGKSIPEGFALGIDALRGTVTGSSVSMADAALGSVKNAISRIGDMVSTDMDSQPTIRPVMDLSEVRTGVDAIGSMLGTTSAMSISTPHLGAISRMMNRQNQNGSNDDVVSAIKDLGKGIDNLPRESYSIGNINYNGDADVEEAIKVLVRAVTQERRA